MTGGYRLFPFSLTKGYGMLSNLSCQVSMDSISKHISMKLYEGRPPRNWILVASKHPIGLENRPRSVFVVDFGARFHNPLAKPNGRGFPLFPRHR